MNLRKARLPLIISVLLMTVVCFGVYWHKQQKPFNYIIEKHDAFSGSELLPPQEKLPVFLDYNRLNETIQTFAAENITVKVWENGSRFKLSGSIHYEKPKRFRLKLRSLVGEELDLGSNDTVFWYWSRRDPRPGVYYAAHEDFYKTRLKTPFNPLFLRESLGLDTLDLTNAKVVEKGNEVMVVSLRKSATGRQVMYSMFLNKATNRMDGVIVSDTNGKPLASCQIAYNGNLPEKIIYEWHEEQRMLALEFKKPQVNVLISPKMWQLPDHKPHINMGEEL